MIKIVNLDCLIVNRTNSRSCRTRKNKNLKVSSIYRQVIISRLKSKLMITHLLSLFRLMKKLNPVSWEDKDKSMSS